MQQRKIEGGLAELAKARRADNASDCCAHPYFCAGCPHNSSTKVPEGARLCGIGCPLWLSGWTGQLWLYTYGGEGANWIGEELFSTRDHVFQNLGMHITTQDPSHPGSCPAGTNITYKILFNDAVAMTGGKAMTVGFQRRALRENSLLWGKQTCPCLR